MAFFLSPPPLFYSKKTCNLEDALLFQIKEKIKGPSEFWVLLLILIIYSIV